MFVGGSRAVAVVVLAALLFAAAGPGYAQGPPVLTDTPIMLGLEGRALRIFFKLARMEGLLRNGEEIPDSLGRSQTVYTYPLTVPYNPTPTFQVGAMVPFVTKRLESQTGDRTRSGVGDASLFVKKLVLQVDRRRETLRAAVKGTLKLPTGNDEGPLPIGTGSLDFGVSAVAGWIKLRWGIYAEVGYIRNTSNGGTDYGDRLAYGAAVGYRVVPTTYTTYPQPQLNAYIECDGHVEGHSKSGSIANANSGGSGLLIVPGLQYIGGRRWLIEASITLPLVDEPNGTQLGSDFSVTAGARILIF